VYRIPRVRRAEYLVVDRHHLQYLNGIERMNCLYCGYGNGVLAYAVEVAARTEQYWCPSSMPGACPPPFPLLPLSGLRRCRILLRRELERLRRELRDPSPFAAGNGQGDSP
jgi:hypothetical protein